MVTGLARGDGPPLVLASGSPTRRRLLEQAGVPVTAVDPPTVDEAAVRRSLAARGATTETAADTLAGLKAERCADRHPGCLVLGADQMLETADGDWLDKPADAAAACAQLLRLQGTTHRLVSGAVLVRDGHRLWQGTQSARLTMRPLDPAFIDDYVAAVGAVVTSTVGAYQIEGLGAHLFTRLDGDMFAIQGLPLLPLLDILRTQGVIRS